MMNTRTLTFLTFSAICSLQWVQAQECDQLQAGFFANAFPLGAQFSNFTSGTGFQTTWNWSFGDGTTSTDPQPQHTYAQPGWYLVCLTAISIYEQQGGGVFTCVDSTCQEVLIPGDTSPCDGLNAEFAYTTDQYTASFNALDGGFSGYQWYFGDGLSSPGTSSIHTYAMAGTYQVCLVVWEWDPQTQDTCYAEHCEFVTVEGADPCDQLQAGFFANAFPVGAQFSNSTSGTGFQTTWNWSFGDGTTSTDPQPQHTYAQPGWYLVCLTAISIYEQQGSGVFTCVDSTCQEVLIPGDSSPCDSLNAFFEVDVDGALVTFFNAVDDPQYSYYWQFGDGSVDFGPNPVHTYPGPGTYEACLLMWAWDPQTQDSCFADHCAAVVIGGGDPCDQLQAGFVANIGNATVWFSNTTTGTGFQTTWFWDFGDGATSTDAQPSHVFPGLGTYEVCLTATSIYELQGGGVVTCQDTHCQGVTTGVVTPCDSVLLDFEWSAQGNSIVFEAVPAPGASFHWFFGDGTNGLGSPVTHLYEPGQDSIWVCLVGWFEIPGTMDSCAVEHCEGVSLSLGISDGGAYAGVSTYPTPFSDVLMIEGLQMTTAGHLLLLDHTGRTVHSEHVPAHTPRLVVRPTGLTPGSYLLRLQTPTGTVIHRVQKD